MSKAADMARVSAKGGFHLLWGLVASTLISSIGTILIASILGEESYGLYGIALVAPNLIAIFRDWGVNTAMIRYSAQYNSQNDTAKIRSIFVSGAIFEIVLGLSLSLAAVFLSDFLAQLVNRPTISFLIQIAALVILSGALINTATAAFTGLEKMHLNSIMLIIQSIFKTGLIIALVLLGLGTLGAVLGFMLSVLIAGSIGMLLMWTMYKSLPKPTNGQLEILATTKTLLKYGLPLSIGAILAGFLLQFYQIILPIYVTDNAIIGNYNVAQNFVVLITFFATPVTTMLFPAFSKLNPQKESETLKNVFQYSVKYASLLVVPVTAMVIALSQPAIGTIFQDRYALAPLFLVLLSISYFYTAIGNLSAANLINGQGYTTYVLKLTVLTAALGFPVSYVLVSNFGVVGLIVTTLTVGLPSLVLSLRFIKKHFGVSVDWVSSAKILFSSATAAILTYLLISQLTLGNPIELALGVIVFLIAFVFVALLTRTVSKADISNLREIVNALGPLRGLLNLLLNVIEKMMEILQPS